MKILLVGSGGREHALAMRLKSSPLCGELFCAPGNAGIAEFAQLIPIAVDDLNGIVSFATNNDIDLVIVGPEGPLVSGLVDRLKEQNIFAFGPTKNAARLEGSKGFMKDLCSKYNIPTAAYGRFSKFSEAIDFVKKSDLPIVVKADGLAAGKGVVICTTQEEAFAAITDMMEDRVFGVAGSEIVIEEFLEGEEVSFFALSDGKTFIPLTSAQDHKRVGDGDEGPNTGGMGAYSPAYFMSAELEEKIIKTIIEPTISGMSSEGCPFTGVLFAGLMIKDGIPKLLEHNVRFGDPECQTLMTRFSGDLVKVLLACSNGTLENVKDEIRWSLDSALCVVMAARGYPGTYEKGSIIRQLKAAASVPNSYVFHAGTSRNEKGDIISIGGRVLGITATGKDIIEAQKSAYMAVDRIDWPEGFCRRDIGWRAVRNNLKVA